MKKLTKRRALSCGYATKEAFQKIDGLSDKDVMMLAAIALTAKDSDWSDRGRDLLRGVHEVLGEDWWS